VRPQLGHNWMMVLRNGPNFRPGSKEEEEEINHI
jgi:hypothetical protein